jgi:hypothetical protein
MATNFGKPGQTWGAQRLQARGGANFRVGFYPVTLGILFALTIVLLTIRLTTWPQSWFDEGLNIATASTVANERVYGLPDSAGIRIMDPAIQTGPPVIMPVALAFQVFGTELIYARLVMVGFGLLALFGFVLLAHRLAGPVGSIIAVGMLLIGTGDLYTSFVPLSRQVLGEVPSFGLFCFGAWLLQRHVDSPQRSTMVTGVMVGIVFGLAMVTKSQMALILPTAVGIFWLLNLVYYRVMNRWLPIVVIGTSVLIVLFWYASQIAIVGIDGYQNNQVVLRDGFAIHIASLSMSGSEAALRAIWATGFLFWGTPGILYGLILMRSRSREGAAMALPLIFTGLWLAWYAAVSIGWSRYAAIPFMLAPIFTGRLVADAVSGRVQLPIQLQAKRYVVLAAMVAVVFGTGIAISKTELRDLFATQSHEHQQIITYMREEIPANAVIETWAWELDPFVSQHLHHPPTQVTNAYTLLIWDGESVPVGTYDPAASEPDYILENMFSTWTGIYTEFTRENGNPVAEFGQYVLYKVR